MRTPLLLFVVFLSCCLAAAKEKPLAEMIHEAESANVKEQPKLYIRVAQNQIHMADSLYSSGNPEGGRAAVENVALYSGKATDAAVESSSRLKDTEIDIRKMAQKLRDIKRNLNYDDQAPVQAASDKLENMRGRLLKKMFEKK